MYTWGTELADANKSSRHTSLMIDSVYGIGSLHRKKQPNRNNSASADSAKENSVQSMGEHVSHNFCS